ncbi:NAD(P)-binding protein [Aspergillus venezuelensis]
MAPSIPKTIATIAGAGPGTGSSIARRFAQTYPVALLSRSQSSLDPLVQDITASGGTALGIPTDVTDSKSITLAIEQMKAEFGADLKVAAAIYNVAAKFTRKPFLEQGVEEFLGALEPTVKGAFNFAQASLPLMLDGEEKYPPTLIFTGATAALKGGPGLSSFAMSKFGIRAMAQSLAREFSPKGIHADAPDSKIDPDWIAESYWFLHTQPRSSFTHEIDLRPGVENW